MNSLFTHLKTSVTVKDNGNNLYRFNPDDIVRITQYFNYTSSIHISNHSGTSGVVSITTGNTSSISSPTPYLTLHTKQGDTLTIYLTLEEFDLQVKRQEINRRVEEQLT